MVAFVVFYTSTSVIKMINADLAVTLIESGREALNINQTCFFRYSLSHISFFHHADLSHLFLLGHPGIKERFYVSKYIGQLAFFIY